MKKQWICILLILALLLSGCYKEEENSASSQDFEVSGGNSSSNWWDNFLDHSKEEAPSAPSQPPSQEKEEEKESNQTKPSSNQTPSKNPFPDKKPLDTGSGTTTPSYNNEEFCLWVSPIGSQKAPSRPAHAVKWQYVSQEDAHYLFCPTEGSLSKMQIWFTGAENCILLGKSYKNGDEISLSALSGKGAVNIKADDHGLYSIAVMKSANIGSMYITTQSGKMDYIHAVKGNEETGTMRMVDAGGKELYNGELSQIRGRGNATWKMIKKGYQIKLPADCDLVGQGAGAAKTWLLIANFSDKTKIHNVVAYDLAADIGMAYTCRSAFVDLYCNGEYMGTYQLCEKVQVANERIEIVDLEKETKAVNGDVKLKTFPKFGQGKTDPGSQKGYIIPKNPKDITGGYLLELELKDRYADETSGFVTKRGKCVVIKEPEHASREQVAYIANYFQEFEDAVFAEDGVNPKTGKRYTEYFDLTSLAQKYIMEELVKNFDTEKTSQFFYKPSDSESKVGYCGPVWDYDNSYDNFKPAARNKGLYAANNQKYLFYEMSRQADFQNEVKKQWKNSYLPLIEMLTEQKKTSKKSLLQPLSYYHDLLLPSTTMDFTLFDNIDVPVYESTYINTGSTFLEHYSYLRNYLVNRAEYLSSQWLT